MTASRPEAFSGTHWSVVLAAGQSHVPEAREALATLCERYWQPLYAYVRRRGYRIEEAQDLTQEFFVRFLEKNDVRRADPARGKFRSYLLASLKHFLADEWDRACAQKRGRGYALISLDFTSAESRQAFEPSHNLTPEKVYEKEWAMRVLDHVLAELRDEYLHGGKQRLFDSLNLCLTGQSPQKSYKQIAAELDMTLGAVKVAVHRLRKRYRELLREELAQTVEGPDAVDEELQALFSVLSS